MGNVHLVTGYAGEAHVAAEDMGSLFAAIVGEGQYVLNRGNMLSATVVSNNHIRIMDGDILMQGRHVRLNEGTYVDLTIENGEQGYMRNDLIVARYTKNEGAGVEDVNLVVVKGTAVASDPSDPEITTGDIVNEGASQNDMPLYRVQLDGINVQPLVCLFDTIGETLSGFVALLNQKVPLTRKVAGLSLSADITASKLLSAIGAAPSSHDQSASTITSGTLNANRLPTVPASKGGTGHDFSNIPANAIIRNSGDNTQLWYTPTANGALYSTSENGGVKFGTLPIAQGGTGATNGATGLKNLFAAGNTVLSSYQYGTSLPTAGTKGRIFFKKVSG